MSNRGFDSYKKAVSARYFQHKYESLKPISVIDALNLKNPWVYSTIMVVTWAVI
jgi:hypothetical protein